MEKTKVKDIMVEIDEELVKRAKDGDNSAFENLIVSLEDYLYKEAHTILENNEDCKDAVQETITSAFLGITKLRDTKLFKTWITRILINECISIYNGHKRKSELTEKIIHSRNVADYFEDNIDFDTMIKSLDENEKEIFRLRYEDRLHVKQIANMLNMNENTVKSILSRGRAKIKKTYKPATILMLILCVLVSASVIAVSVISYIQSLFELGSMGKDNSGVLSAIEHLEWFQEVDVGTIDLGNGYKISPDYLLMDEMNLYMVLNITSEKDVNKITDVSFPDLKIVDESGNVICDQSDYFKEQYTKASSVKIIENKGNSIKVLFYMYTDSFPISKTLDVSLTTIHFLNRSFLGNETISDISANANFKIKLSDKFINRNYTTYTSESPEIEKAIITETGFYAIVHLNKLANSDHFYLIDENNTSYECYKNIVNYYDDSYSISYFITSPFSNSDCKTLKLVIDNNEYNLIKN